MRSDEKANKTLSQFYNNKKTLVTGGASFIGSHLVETLVACGAKVTVADDLSSGKLENLKTVQKQIQFEKGDLRNEEFAQKVCSNQEIVFHLAAAHGGRGYIDSHPVECTNNMVLDHIVFAKASLAGVKKIIYASSACVYPTNLQADSSSRLLLKESDCGFDIPGKAFSDGEYGWAKLMGELQLRAFYKQYGISGIVCRIFTAFGERENESHAVIALIAKAVNQLDPFPIWGDGLQTRNFTYVKDTLMGLALSGASLNGFQVANVGSSQHHTVLDLIDCIFKSTGWKPKSLKKELDKPVGVKSRASDNTYCLEHLKWEPSYTLEESVSETVSWYISNVGKLDATELEKRLMQRSV